MLQRGRCGIFLQWPRDLPPRLCSAPSLFASLLLQTFWTHFATDAFFSWSFWAKMELKPCRVGTWQVSYFGLNHSTSD